MDGGGHEASTRNEWNILILLFVIGRVLNSRERQMSNLLAPFLLLNSKY